MALKVLYGKCTGCSPCLKACPFAALELVDRDTISFAWRGHDRVAQGAVAATFLVEQWSR